jgi:hypothetical protein
MNKRSPLVVLLLLKTISFIASYKGSARSTLFVPVQGSGSLSPMSSWFEAPQYDFVARRDEGRCVMATQSWNLRGRTRVGRLSAFDGTEEWDRRASSFGGKHRVEGYGEPGATMPTASGKEPDAKREKDSLRAREDERGFISLHHYYWSSADPPAAALELRIPAPAAALV